MAKSKLDNLKRSSTKPVPQRGNIKKVKRSQNIDQLLYPPVGFRYEVKFEDSGLNSDKADASFAEVSGISAVINTEEVIEGGENRFKHRLPLPPTYSPLVLKRGVAKASSEFLYWMEDNHYFELELIELRNIVLNLLDETREPLASWTFFGAYPTKYEVSGLKADANQIAIESFELSYRYFQRLL